MKTALVAGLAVVALLGVVIVAVSTAMAPGTMGAPVDGMGGTSGGMQGGMMGGGMGGMQGGMMGGGMGGMQGGMMGGDMEGMHDGMHDQCPCC